MKSALCCALLSLALVALVHAADKDAAAQKTTSLTSQTPLIEPVTILAGLDTPVVTACDGPSCPQDETIITCTGPLLPPFSNDPKEFCNEKEPCDRDVLSRMKRLWEQRERLAHQEQAERVAQRECLFRQMEKHRKDIIQLNVAAAKIRDKFLDLTRTKANLQARVQAIQTMMQDINLKTAEDYAAIQRNRTLMLEEAHQKAKKEEEAAKSARIAAIKAKREREQKEDELEKAKAELQKMEIEEEKVKVQEQKQKTLAKMRREKQSIGKSSSRRSHDDVDETRPKLDPEDSVKAKEVETHGRDEEDDEDQKKNEEEEEENEKKIEKLLGKDDEDRGPVGKLPRKFSKTQKAVIVDKLDGSSTETNSTSEEADGEITHSAPVQQRDEEDEGSDDDDDDKKVHIKIHGTDMLVTKKDLEGLKKKSQEDEGDEEGAEPKPSGQKVDAKQNEKEKEKEQVHKTVQKQENSAKEALKQAEQIQKND